MKISESQKREFHKLLERNPELDFDEEFIRTTNFERKIINDFGFEGIEFILKKDSPKSNFFPLENFPKESPWFNLNSKSISNLISENFNSLENVIPDLISALKERCKFIFLEKTGQNWFLCYFLDCKLYDGRDYYRIYKGGIPNLNPKPNEYLAKNNWDIPKDLKRFYAIHDGFGELTDCNFILNCNELRLLGELMNPVCKEYDNYPEGYKFDDLLEFFPDGSGNCQCFFRYQSETNFTVDWDHDTWELGEKENFFDFINEILSEIDEE